jgi:hypothetical protein
MMLFSVQEYVALRYWGKPTGWNDLEGRVADWLRHLPVVSRFHPRRTATGPDPVTIFQVSPITNLFASLHLTQLCLYPLCTVIAYHLHTFPLHPPFPYS